MFPRRDPRPLFARTSHTHEIHTHLRCKAQHHATATHTTPPPRTPRAPSSNSHRLPLLLPTGPTPAPLTSARHRQRSLQPTDVDSAPSARSAECSAIRGTETTWLPSRLCHLGLVHSHLLPRRYPVPSTEETNAGCVSQCDVSRFGPAFFLLFSDFAEFAIAFVRGGMLCVWRVFLCGHRHSDGKCVSFSVFVSAIASAARCSAARGYNNMAGSVRDGAPRGPEPDDDRRHDALDCATPFPFLSLVSSPPPHHTIIKFWAPTFGPC